MSRRRRPGAGRPRLPRVLAAGLSAGALLLGAVPAGAAPGAPRAATAPAPDGSPASIVAEQDQLVGRAYQAAVDWAEAAVGATEEATYNDEVAVSRAVAASAAATAAVGRDTGAVTAARASVSAAADAASAAQAVLSGDRVRLRAIAIGLYTGDLSGADNESLDALAADEDEVLGVAEVDLITNDAVTDLGNDAMTARLTGAEYLRQATRVSAAQNALAAAQRAAGADAAGVTAATAALGRVQTRLLAAESTQATAQAAQTAAEAAIAEPGAAPSGISILGPATLDAAQLAAWFNWAGYVDFTSASIQQLAGWYVEDGALEGIRGDVAFAQAILETGGFSSSDATGLNNYAGIGHCDSCDTGWAFPSPQGGVLGQVQLLRIFAAAGAAPANAPAPVLPQLTPANQGRHGCCGTWESLTGVWATDPIYGTSILELYQSMLMYALDTPAS